MNLSKHRISVNNSLAYKLFYPIVYNLDDNAKSYSISNYYDFFEKNTMTFSWTSSIPKVFSNYINLVLQVGLKPNNISIYMYAEKEDKFVVSFHTTHKTDRLHHLKFKIIDKGNNIQEEYEDAMYSVHMVTDFGIKEIYEIVYAKSKTGFIHTFKYRTPGPIHFEKNFIELMKIIMYSNIDIPIEKLFCIYKEKELNRVDQLMILKEDNPAILDEFYRYKDLFERR